MKQNIALSNAGNNPRHFQRGMSGFGPPIVLGAEATDFGVLDFVENEHGMNHRNFLQHLDLSQCVGDAPTDVLGVARFALENDAEANNGGITSGSGQSGGHGGNFECPRHTHNAEPGFGIV